VLNVSYCKGVTDAALAHLKGIHTLDITRCQGVTDTGLAHLKGIHTLDMGGCYGITDAGLVHLKGIHTLDMSYCEGVTDACLEHLKGIHTLNINGSYGIKGNRIAELGCNLKILVVRDCTLGCGVTADHIYGVTKYDPKVTRYPASCRGGSRGGGYTRTKKRKQRRYSRHLGVQNIGEY
jgi:hypothetical protein